MRMLLRDQAGLQVAVFVKVCNFLACIVAARASEPGYGLLIPSLSAFDIRYFTPVCGLNNFQNLLNRFYSQASSSTGTGLALGIDHIGRFPGNPFFPSPHGHLRGTRLHDMNIEASDPD